MATTRIEVAPGRCRLSDGLLAARRLPTVGPCVVRVGLVATQALLLAGDHVRIEVDVRGDVTLEVVETTGTVAYDMRGGSARWDVAIGLGDGARLTWAAEPFVVAAGADVTRSTEIRLQPGSVATLRDPLVLGRSSEVGGRLVVSTRVMHGDVPLLVEDLDLAPDARAGHAVLGTHRCLDTLTMLGDRLPEAPGTLQLAGPGSIARWMGAAAHESPLDEWHLSRGRREAV